MSDDDRLARAALSAVIEPGDRVVGALIAAHGAAEVLAAIRAGTLPAAALEHYRTRLPAAQTALEALACGRLGLRFVPPGSGEWPAQLDDLAAARPLGLWVRGAPFEALTRRSVAVVGARACTAYGEQVAAELAAVIAERGWTVVSGAAYGIDAAAHRGALAAHGPTVAVLACGVDVTYPRGHDRLLARILDSGGALASEAPPGEHVTKPRFLQRNRVIAALTRGTVVVEAAWRSGALNTASHAAELARHVMAVPGPVTSTASAGCHRLVREGGAVLVACGEHVVELVGPLGQDVVGDERGETRPHDALDPQTLRVLEALPARRVVATDTVVLRAGLAVPVVLAALAELATRRLVEAHPAGWRLRHPAQPA